MHISTLNRPTPEIRQIRLGLQGDPASGKTTSALTAPNPVILNFDNNIALPGVQTIPFWDPEFINGLEGGKFKAKLAGRMPNRRDALLWFLEKEGFKYTSEQTLVLDSWTFVQNAFDEEPSGFQGESRLTKDGKEDPFAFWGQKIDFSKKVLSYFASFQCNIIVTFHESKVRDDKSGQLLDKIAPLMQGKFVSQIKAFFTDFYRTLCVAENKKDTEGKTQRVNPQYFWQVRSDNLFDARCSLKNLPKDAVLIEPKFEAFTKYK